MYGTGLAVGKPERKEKQILKSNKMTSRHLLRQRLRNTPIFKKFPNLSKWKNTAVQWKLAGRLLLQLFWKKLQWTLREWHGEIEWRAHILKHLRRIYRYYWLWVYTYSKYISNHPPHKRGRSAITILIFRYIKQPKHKGFKWNVPIVVSEGRIQDKWLIEILDYFHFV